MSDTEFGASGPVLTWKHNKQSKTDAIVALTNGLHDAGYADKVRIIGDTFSHNGFGLRLSGRVTDTEVVIDRCSGIAGGEVLGGIKDALGKMFPGGGK